MFGMDSFNFVMEDNDIFHVTVNHIVLPFYLTFINVSQ